MFCTNCGKELPQNANFCSHCGQKQGQEKSSSGRKENITNQLTDTARPKIVSPTRYVKPSYSRKAIGFYLVWIFFNLFLLLVLSDGIFSNSNSNSGIGDFWPLNGFDVGEYDITEFLVYTVFPLAYLYIRNLIRGRS